MLAVATVIDASDQETEYDDRPIVSFYDLKTLNLVCTLTESPDVTAVLSESEDVDHEDGNENASSEDDSSENTENLIGRRRHFVKLRFLYDNVSMAAFVIGAGGTECVMYYYRWKTSTVDTYVRIDGSVYDVSRSHELQYYYKNSSK